MKGIRDNSKLRKIIRLNDLTSDDFACPGGCAVCKLREQTERGGTKWLR